MSGLFQPLAAYSPITPRNLRSKARPASFDANHLLMDLLLTKSSSHLKPADASFDTPGSASDETEFVLESEVVDHAFSELCGNSATDHWNLS